MKKTLYSSSPEETEKIGEDFAREAKSGTLVLLSGTLGAGKTVFVKGVAKELEIDEGIVSPTFTLVQEYQGKMKMHHLDLYRISGCDEFESMGGEEFLYSDGITLIEWAEKIEDMIPDGAVRVNIEILEDQRRKITIE